MKIMAENEEKGKRNLNVLAFLHYLGTRKISIDT